LYWDSVFGKGPIMTNLNDPHYRRDLDLDDPRYRREFEQEADEEGVSMAAWAGVVFLVLLLGGIAVFTFSTPHSNLASGNPPGIEQPVTTGQGGAQSKMPPAQEQTAPPAGEAK